MTYAEASRLFRHGRFREIIDGFKGSRNTPTTDRQLSLLVAYVLALTDDAASAAPLINIDVSKLTAAQHAQVEVTSGIISWRSGDNDSALRQLQGAVRLARGLQSPEVLGWAYLHLFRFAVEVQPRDVVLGMLKDVRTAVTRAGDAALTSYLHVCVAVLEGQRGQLDEAMRHCDIAESLLENSPNAWILGASLINRSCVASLQCDFSRAAEYARRAIGLSNTTGLLIQRGAAEIMSGYLQLLVGDFPKAEQTLSNLVSQTEFNHSLRPAADLLARVYLACGELEKCETTLRLVEFPDSEAGLEGLAYGTRWAALTKAKLFLRRHEYRNALSWLESLETGSSKFEDRPFKGVVELLVGRSLHALERRRESARRIIRAES